MGLVLFLLAFSSLVACRSSESTGAPSASASVSPALPLESSSPPTPAPTEAKPAPISPALRAPRPGEKPFLWKVVAKSPVYLLGSIHLGKEGLYPLHPAVEKAFASADTLAVEVHMTPKAKADAQTLALELGLYPPGDSLPNHLTLAVKKRYESHLATQGHPRLMFDRMRPWLAATTLLTLDLGALGYDPEQGIDLYFQERAEEMQKEIISLESARGQIELLAELPERVQLLMLDEYFREAQTLGDRMKAGFAAWEAGDPQGLEKALAESIYQPEYAPLYEGLFVRRNHEMAKKVAELAEGPKAAFVVVGAMHLAGRKSILEHLRAAGLPVEKQ